MGALGFQALGRTVGGLDPAPTIGGERMRLHRLQGRKGWRFALLGLTALVFSVFFVAASSGNLTGSTFESTDGNLVKSTGSDWCNAVNGSGVCTSTAPKLVEGQDKAPGSHDDSFANGTKQDDAVPSVGNGGIPNKGDLDRFYVANEFVGGKNFVYLGFELLPVSNASASVHIGFEFNQNACDLVTHTGCSGNNVTPTRSEGDVLVVYDLEGGGNPALSFRRWVLSGPCEVSQDTAPCWGPKQSLNSSVADGSLDAGASGTTDPINPGAPRTIGQFRFGEAAINLTDSNIVSGCAALGSVYTVSRSSGDSGTATMKDFIAPQKVNISNCGTIKIKKVTDPSPDATNTSFSFTAGGGLTPTSCDDGSPVSNIDVGAGETGTCTFNDRQRGSVSIHKQDDAGNALQGAVFELYTDNAPTGGNPPHGAEDTATGQTCTTNASGDCTISNVVPGPYWIVETTTPTGYDSAADKSITVSAGQNTSVTLTD